MHDRIGAIGGNTTITSNPGQATEQQNTAPTDGVRNAGGLGAPASSRRLSTPHAGVLRGEGDGCCRCFGLEWPHLGVVWADDAVGGFGYLVPDAGDVTERFGDDQPRVV
jgi:hypothetical protein